MKFIVIDKKTGKEADTWNIALNEEWAKGLIYCDMEGFAITEDGNLVLMDECGNVVYCNTERFKVVFEDDRPHGEWILDAVSPCSISWFRCSYCGYKYNEYKQSNFCPNCGADMREGEVK